MIFITVGTHEQGFDRLLKAMDEMIEKKYVDEEVFAQSGFTKYKPKNYKYESMISYDKMQYYNENSRIIITHGGPGSIFLPLQYGKIPIVVPRNPKFNEHVDNHQILFTKRLEKAKKVLAVYDIDDLAKVILNYDTLIKKCELYKNSKNDFTEKFDRCVSNLWK